jgi:hypothetical protein
MANTLVFQFLDIEEKESTKKDGITHLHYIISNR